MRRRVRQSSPTSITASSKPSSTRGIDLEREVQVDGPLAAFLGMQVDLPGLAQRVALDEVTFVVHVEAVLDGVVFEIGDEPGDVEYCHSVGERTERARANRC